MRNPNLFDFATSELSQDAFIGWLLSWAKPEFERVNPALNSCAMDVLKCFFKKHDRQLPSEIKSIDISKQDKNIDVLCVVNGEYSLIIEDKTHTSQHSGQLKRYFDEVLHRGFDEEKILPIYFKTRDQSDYRPVEDAGYQSFLRCDFLKILDKYESLNNDIFQDFRLKLVSIEESVQSYKILPLDKWHWDSWVGFYVALKKELSGAGWGYVANPSGGFLGFTFSWNGNVYLQLEQKDFCFKIEVLDREKQSSQRWAWHDAFMRAAKNTPFKLKKPRRFGKGSYMTVCVLDEEYRKTKNGILDFPETVRFINDISEFMKTVSVAPDGEAIDDGNGGA